MEKKLELFLTPDEALFIQLMLMEYHKNPIKKKRENMVEKLIEDINVLFREQARGR